MNPLRRLLAPSGADPVAFWRGRAAEPGWLSVMWRNPAYNALAHRDQWAAIERNLPGRRDAVLDLGCGTGRLSAALAARFERYVGVDLDTMVAEARRRNPELGGEYVAQSVQDYAYPEGRFDLVLSMACLASAARADELPALARRIVGATRPGGRIVMIDPFHRAAPLVRTCRLTAREVIGCFEACGAALVEWSGVHFVPGRLALARGALAAYPRLTRAGYEAGEALSRLWPRRLADYQVIALERRAS